MLGRTEEMILQGERHLQNRGRRRALARSSVLLVISKATMLHSVHNERKGKGSNKHHQQRWMRLQIGLRGSSYWSPPFLVQFPVVRLDWWIEELLVI